MHRARLIGAAALLAVGLIAAWTQPASAFVTGNTAWIQGRAARDYYSPHTALCSSGIQLYSRSNLHAYLMVAAHCLEDGYNNGFGSPPFMSWYEGSSANQYDGAVGTVLHPSGTWAKYDMKLVDLGVRQSIPMDTNQVWNYCSPYPNCGSNYGGGTSVPPNWAGYPMTTIGGVNPWVGMSTCKSGAKTGTSCGTLRQAVWMTYAGYEYWAWFVNDLGNCKLAPGDSSGAVYLVADQAATQVYQAGIVVAKNELMTYNVSPGDPCLAYPGTFAQSFYFIPWTSARDAWPSLSLVPLV